MNELLLSGGIGAVVGSAATMVYTYLKTAATERAAVAAREAERNARNERDAIQDRAARADAELATLRRLFDVQPTAEDWRPGGALAPFAAVAERELARLSRDARSHVATVASLETGLPIASEGIDELTARLYSAGAAGLVDAAEGVVPSCVPSASAGGAGCVAEVSLDVADELNVRVARLDLDARGLVLVAVGPVGSLGDAAWGRAMLGLGYASPMSVAAKAGPPRGQSGDGARVDAPGDLPRSFADAMKRAGVRTFRFVRQADDAAAPDWARWIEYGVRRIPGGATSRSVFRARPTATPGLELLMVRDRAGEWALAIRDASLPDPVRLIDQVSNYLRFQADQQTAVAS